MSFRTRMSGIAVGLATMAAPAAAQDFYRLATLGPGSSPYLVMSTLRRSSETGSTTSKSR